MLTNVGIREDESLTERILHPIHLAANDAKQGLAIDQDFNAILLNRFVERARLVNVLEVVGQATAAAVLDTHLYELGIWLIE